MATATEVTQQVDLLADAYGRTFREEGQHYEAYMIALSDVEFDHLRRGVIGLIRDRLQFMPTPAEVRCHALAVRGESRRRAEDECRITCLRCSDTGCVTTVNRRWVAEHRDEFAPEWFVDGWLRAAVLECRERWREDMFVTVACGCRCHASEVWLHQLDAWREWRRANREGKEPWACFKIVYDERCDCLVGVRSANAVRDSLLVMEANTTRSWAGNWNP